MTQPNSLSMSFVGDICLSMGVEQQIAEKGAAYPFNYLTQLMADSDIRIGNLECSIVTDDVDRSNKRMMTVATSAVADFKHNSQLDVVSLANNHIMDGGLDGLINTLSLLSQEQMTFFGAGLSQEQAEAPVIVNEQGKKIAFIGVCDVSRFNAQGNQAGVGSWHAARLKKQIVELKTHVDLIVVNLHGDLEFTQFPQPSRVKLSRLLVDYGAHLVIQHHPHVVQGIERYKHGIVAYSLGNCIFQVANNPYQGRWQGTDIGIALNIQVTFGDDNPIFDYQVMPFKVGEHHCPEPLSEQETELWLQEFEHISAALSDKKIVKQHWKNRVRREAKRRFGDLYWALRRKKFKTVANELRHMLCSPEERRWLKGLLSTLFV